MEGPIFLASINDKGYLCLEIVGYFGMNDDGLYYRFTED